ncbi:MAG: peptide/nickel transport system substrate-binding protein, partial [Chloroflexota bacterium]|nr:peptide/nickel transport system substrate-binding protein [Chloroflexota bacterium]
MRMSWSRSAVLIAALLAMSACAPATQPGGGSSTGNGAASAPQAPATPKRVVAAIPGSPTNFYQKFNLSSTIRGVEELEELVNSGFSILDAQGHSQARLAEQVPTLDNGLWKLLPDGTMETTWKIRQGAIWHDGTPVTAHDAVFAAQIGQDRDLPISRDLSYGSIQRIEEVDDHTVTVHWKAPYILADQQFSPRAALPLPSHLMEQAYRADKQSFLAQPFWADQWVGTGPFRIAEFVRDSHMVLTANDQFVLGRPKIDQIEMRFIVDPTTMIANVMAGTVDVTVGRGTSLEQAVQVRDTWRDGKVDLAVASFSQIFPQFINPNPAIVANLQFRRALLMALNRQEMVDSIQYGLVP